MSHQHRSRRHSSETPGTSHPESRPHTVRAGTDGNSTGGTLSSRSRHGKQPRRHVIERKLARKQLLQALGVAMFVVIATGIAMLGLSRAHRASQDAYVLWDAARTVIHYMQKHDGAWPRQWEELKEEYNELPTLMGAQPWSDVVGRVNVDFAADPAILTRCELQPDQAPFQVISLKSGKHHHLKSAEPNTLILEYLKKRQIRQLRENSQPAAP